MQKWDGYNIYSVSVNGILAGVDLWKFNPKKTDYSPLSNKPDNIDQPFIFCQLSCDVYLS